MRKVHSEKQISQLDIIERAEDEWTQKIIDIIRVWMTLIFVIRWVKFAQGLKN